MTSNVMGGRAIPAVAAAGILLNVHKILSSLKSHRSLMCNFSAAWDLSTCVQFSLWRMHSMEYKLSQICGRGRFPVLLDSIVLQYMLISEQQVSWAKFC
jgi:hypothetical protein